MSQLLSQSLMAVQVTGFTPLRNARHQLAASPIVVQFDSAIDPGTVTAGSFQVVGELTGKRAGSFSFALGNTEITFIASSPFASGETVRINVSSRIHDTLGAAINPSISQFTVRSGASAAEFARGVIVGNSGGSSSVIACELNGDGKLDLVVNSSVLLGRGDGTFNAPVVYPAAAGSGCVADVNGDGRADILTASYSAGTMSVLLGDGTGVFGTPTTYPISAGGSANIAPGSFVTGDFDGDGYVDIAVSRVAGFQVFWNDGTGLFPTSVEINVHDRGTVLALGDVNGDGLSDFLCGDDRGNYFSVTINLGNRTFATPVKYGAGNGNRGVALADLNGDGTLDVVAGNFQANASITTYVNGGNGAFMGRMDYPVNSILGPWGVCVADFDGDGRPDVATANMNSGIIYGARSVSLWRNSGGSSGAAAFDIRKDFDSSQNYPAGIAFGDFDADGDLDLIIANYFGAICFLRNAPAGITGLVYRDVNANCVQNLANDIGLGGRFVRVTDSSGGVRLELSRLDGTFAFVVPAGNYTVTLVHDANTVETCNGGVGVTHNVTVSGGSPATGLKFGVARNCQATVSCVSKITWPCPPNPPVPCTHGNDHHLRNLCPCEPFQYAVTVRNTGTDPLESGSVVRLHLAQEVMFCGFPAQISDHAAFNVVGSLTANGQGIPNPYPACDSDCSPNTGQVVKWKLNNTLAPGDSCTFFVNVQVANVPLGTIPCAIPSLRAFCKPGHIPLNVTGPTWCDKVLCSYDPNDLTVSPAGCGPNGNVPPGTTLTYRLRFQNLGTAAARRVLVRNVLDPALDPNTLEILSTSHPVTDFKILPGQAMVWTFDFIDLPAAITDEAGSHGEIRYRIKPKTSAGTGTAIRNYADIYFDLNAPIRTVTTLNTLSTDPAPVAIYNVTPHSGSAGFAHDFTYTGGTAGATFAWDFGPDATPRTSTLANPAGVVFNNAGPHLVTLRTSLGDCESEPAVRIVTVGRPLLAIDAAPGGPLLSWEGDGYRVQETDSLSPPIVWRPVSATPVGLSGFYSVQLTEPGSTRFYRLEQAQ